MYLRIQRRGTACRAGPWVAVSQLLSCVSLSRATGCLPTRDDRRCISLLRSRATGCPQPVMIVVVFPYCVHVPRVAPNPWLNVASFPYPTALHNMEMRSHQSRVGKQPVAHKKGIASADGRVPNARLVQSTHRTPAKHRRLAPSGESRLLVPSRGSHGEESSAITWPKGNAPAARWSRGCPPASGRSPRGGSSPCRPRCGCRRPGKSRPCRGWPCGRRRCRRP